MKQKILKTGATHPPFFVLLAIYFAFALITFKDYGISFDENTEYTWGKALLNHYRQDTRFKNSIEPICQGEIKHQRHTPILSHYYRLYTATLNLVNTRNTYEFFHLLNMIFASSLLVAAYVVIFNKYKSGLLALLGPFFILAMPRFLGHIPTNPKDMPFAVVYFLGLISIYYSPKIKNDYIKILVLGIVFGFVQSFRVVGISIYIIYAIWLLYTQNNKVNFIRFIQEQLPKLILIFIVANFVAIMTWPYLGVNYIKNFSRLFLISQRFDHWDKPYLYLGNYINIDTRPWHYLPVFILLTTPLFVLVSFGYAVKTYVRNKKDSLSFLLLTTLCINLLMYLVVRPTIYNGIRHFLYLLPIISFLGALGSIEFLKTTSKYKTAIVGLVAINIVSVFVAMYKLHPYEYIYFNEAMAPIHNLQEYFELDYWGISYKEAIEWLNTNTPNNEKFSVFTCANSFTIDYYAKANISRAYKIEDSDFLICDYTRFNDYTNHEVLHTVTRKGMPLNIIAKTIKKDTETR